jgi:hypothetical protein
MLDGESTSPLTGIQFNGLAMTHAVGQEQRSPLLHLSAGTLGRHSIRSNVQYVTAVLGSKGLPIFEGEAIH